MSENILSNSPGSNRLPPPKAGAESRSRPKKNEALYAEFVRHEKACRSASSLVALSRQVLLITGDRTYAGMLLSKALVLCTDFDTHLAVAEIACRDLMDINWSRTLYRQLIDRYDSSENREQAAESILGALKDRAWAKRIFTDLENGAETPESLVRLARIVRTALADSGWSRRLLEKAETRLADRREAIMLADTVREILGDHNWMHRLFLTAEEHCRNRFQYEYLIEIVDLKAGDGKLLSNILKRAEAKLTAPEDLHYLAETILYRFEDTAWSERIESRAKAAAGSKKKPVSKRPDSTSAKYRTTVTAEGRQSWPKSANASKATG